MGCRGRGVECELTQVRVAAAVASSAQGTGRRGRNASRAGVRTGAALAPSAHEREWVGLWYQALINVAKAWVKPYERKRLPKRLPRDNEPLAERSQQKVQACKHELRKRLRYKQIDSSVSLAAMSKRLHADLL